MPEVVVFWGKHSPNNTVGSSGITSPIASAPYPITGSSNHVNSTFGGWAPGNSTSSNCGTPPSRMIDSFYTAACGSPTFDQDIDNEKIGCLDFSCSDFSASLEDFAQVSITTVLLTMRTLAWLSRVREQLSVEFAM